MDFALNVVTAHRVGNEPDHAQARSIAAEHLLVWHLKRQGVAAHVPETPLTDEATDLHAQTLAEIREENPEADEQEVKLRVAIRESVCTTRENEDDAYDRINEALQS